MSRRLMLALVVAAGALVLASACGGSAKAPAPAATSTSEAPAARTTGIAEVDAVLAAVAAGDAAAFEALVTFQTEACSTAPAAGQPSCRPDETDGTPVDYLPETITGFCRVATRSLQLRKDEIESLLSSLGETPVYALYRDRSGDLPDLYVATWAQDARDVDYSVTATQVSIASGKVVAANQVCAKSRGELAQDVPPDAFALPPAD
jgi:hypothetical protein